MITKISNACFITLYFIIFIGLTSKAEQSADDSDLILLDGVAAIRIGSSGLTPTYYSDAWFFSPFGRPKTLCDVIIENLWISYGNEHGIKIVSNESSHEYAEQYLDMMQSQKNISRKEIEKIAAENGYTFNDIKRELNKQYLIQQTIETYFAANSCLNISSSEISEHCKAITLKETNRYTFRIGSLSIKDSGLEATTHPETYVKKHYEKIIWENPYQIREEELNENLRKKENLNQGGIIHYEKNSKGDLLFIYELINITKEVPDKAEIYDAMTKKLQQAKYEENLSRITKNFLQSPSMKYDTDDIREDCLKTFNK
jgi:hypothetical protein